MARIVNAVILLMLAGCQQLKPTPAPAPAAAPQRFAWASIRIALAARQEQPGLQKMTSKQGQTAYVAAETLLDERAIQAARALHSPQGHVVELEFTAPAAAELAAITRAHRGELLAFIVDGELISAPLIASEVGKLAYLSGDFSAAQAEDLARRVRPPQ